MDRKGHYVKPGRRPMVPAVVFGVCVEPSIAGVDGEPDAVYRGFGSASAWVSRRVRGKWRHPEGITTQSPAELFAWMAQRARNDARNYVVAPVASDVLTLTGFWDLIEREGCAWEPVKSTRRTGPEDTVTRFRRLVLRGVPDIIDFTRRGRRWVWLSLGQYLPAGEEAIAKSLRVHWLDTGRYDATGTKGQRTANERAHLCLKAMCSLADWWGRHSRSPFGFTAGQLAWGVLRTHITPKSLCTHSDADVHQLERQACFGGRASTFYVGDVGDVQGNGSFLNPCPNPSKYGTIPGPLHLIDVRSMYPHLLATEQFPRKMWSSRYAPKVKDIVSQARTYGVVASVTIQTKAAEFPRRSGDRIGYPLGTFHTVLSAPEIVALARVGRIVEVHRAALYDVGPVFQAAARELIDMRERARRAGDESEEFFAKLLANALGGKLAQRRGQWHERRKMASFTPWGEWVRGRGPDGRPRRFRAIAGLVWEFVTDKTGSGPHTAAFAHLTALGRIWMARIRAVCPPWSVVSQDTDGIWVTDEGLAAVKAAGFPFGDRAGELRVAKTVAAARFFGPRHYWTPEGWILAGFNMPEVHTDGATVTDTRTDNPVRRTSDGAPGGIVTRTRRSQLKLDVPEQEVDPMGWCHPKVIG